MKLTVIDSQYNITLSKIPEESQLLKTTYKKLLKLIKVCYTINSSKY